MNAKTEDMIERYLEAVAAQLAPEERDDIVAELRDLILSRIEAREEELGRALTDDEREAILQEIGHPLVVAARYRKGPDSLIGPELFPYWLYGVKAGLLVLLAIAAAGLLIRLISGSANFGQDIAQAFHGWFGSALTLIGSLTLLGAVMEHYGMRPKWLTEWRVKDLAAFGLADPSRWGAAIQGASGRQRLNPQPWGGTRWTPRSAGVRENGGEALFSAIATTVFLLWWVGAIRFQGFGIVRMSGEDATVAAAPVWAWLYLPILFYALAQIGIDLYRAFRPDAVRIQAVLSLIIAGVGLWLTWTVFEAGHWFTLSVGSETARVGGDWALLNAERLRTLGDGERDLTDVAATLSVIGTWVLAISGISLVVKVLRNAWQVVRA